MLDRLERTVTSSEFQPSPRQTISFSQLFEFLRLRRRVIAGSLILALGAAFGYIQFTVPVFTAVSQVIIDSRLPQFIPGRSNDSTLAWDTAQVESEIAVLQSERISGRVVRKLHLDLDATFRTAPSIWARGLALLQSHFETPASETDGFREAINTIANGLAVRRTGLSYAIEISFTFPDARRAQVIANAIADSYIADQLENRAEAARVGGEWLQQRLTQLRSQMNTAGRAVEVFRATHDYTVQPLIGSQTASPTSSQSKSLDELDSDAATYRRIYESFLQSYTESVQRQSFPVSDAHILTEANLPLSKSAPKSILIYALATLLGLLSGFGAAVLLQSLDRTVRSGSQVAEETGVENLGTIPMPHRRFSRMRSGLGRALSAMVRRIGPSKRDYAKRRNRGLAPFGKAYSFAASAKGCRTPFGLSLTAMKTFVDLAHEGRRSRCIGITSNRRDSGCSMIAGNLALLYAADGLKTLLIDADFKHKTLSRAWRDASQSSPAPSSSDERCLDLIPLSVDGSSIDFLPASESNYDAPDTCLRERSLPMLLRRVVDEYDIVILDLPPVLPFGSVLSLTHHLNWLIVAIRAGGSSLDQVTAMFKGLARTQVSMLGFVVTKTLS